MGGSNPYMVVIRDGFSSSSYTDTNTPFILKISGLRNSRSLAESGTFQLKIKSQSDTLLRQKLTDMKVTMITPIQIPSITIVPSNLENGATAYYTITLTSPTPLISNDVLKI